MKVKKTNIFMTRGDSETILISLKDTSELPIPFVTGDTVYFTVKNSTTSVEKELQKVITEFVDGKALVEITPEDTKSLNFRTYMYDVQLTKDGGQVITLVKPSEFTIEEEITYE